MEVKSTRHNLSSEEKYVRLEVPDAGHLLRCEHFSKYGEEGHELTYFRGNDNIPSFVKSLLLPRIVETVEPVTQLAMSKRSSLEWKMTLNVYKAQGGTVSGFPYHVDIPSNGAVTMILSLIKGAPMELRALHPVSDQDFCRVEMDKSSLLVLSGASRFDWMHRVLPHPNDDSAQVSRVSIVLGCK